MKNQPYLSWISNQDLFKAVEYVYEKYRKSLKTKNLRSFNKNIIDPFTFIFDVKLSNKLIEDWLLEELARQLQKSLNNAVGEFHQILLGSCSGWINLGTRHRSGLDISKIDESIFAEIKNKFNTMNARSEESVFKKLEEAATIYPSATIYLVQIIKKPGIDSYDVCWQRRDIANEKIRKISGDKFYEKVTGDANALKDLYSVIPLVISDFINQRKASFEIIEDKLINQIASALGKQKPSEQDIIDYFFEMAYPSNSQSVVAQELTLPPIRDFEDEAEEISEDFDDEEEDTE